MIEAVLPTPSGDIILVIEQTNISESDAFQALGQAVFNACVEHLGTTDVVLNMQTYPVVVGPYNEPNKWVFIHCKQDSAQQGVKIAPLASV